MNNIYLKMCKNGNLDVVKLYTDGWKNDKCGCVGKRDHEVEECGLSISCYNNKFDIATYLCDRFEYEEDTITNLIYELCMAGKLDAVKFLINRFNKTLKYMKKIHKNNLIPQQFNINVTNYDIFIIYCFIASFRYRQLNIVKYLDTLFKIPNIIFKKINIYIIKSDPFVDLHKYGLEHYLFLHDMSFGPLSDIDDMETWLNNKLK